MNRATQALVEARFRRARAVPPGAPAPQRTRRAVARAARAERRLRAAGRSDLRRFEGARFSQNGEDGVLAELVRRIGAQRRTFVEIGASDGRQNCTRALLEDGWSGVWVEGDAAAAATAREVAAARPVEVVQAFVDRDDVVERLGAAGADERADVLVIDVDGNDWWIWRALAGGGWRPAVVVVEYNPHIGPLLDWRLPYDPAQCWDGSARYGASLQALARLGRRLGYALVHCDTTGTNAFFVQRALAASLPAGSARRHFAAGQHVQGVPSFGRPVTLDAPPVDAGEGLTLAIDRICNATPAPGEPLHITAWVRNDGDVAVGAPATHPVALAWRWNGEDSEPRRAVAPAWRLQPGERTLLGCRAVAPAQAGTHHLELALVQEGVRWFAPPGRLSVPVQVGGQPTPSAPRPRRRGGRGYRPPDALEAPRSTRHAR